MRKITLIGTEIRTTALGFGTSTLMGRLTKRESLRLLEVAYENGVRHFDTAPLYGYGESEGVVGIFARSRSDITIATKFGLLRPQANSFLFRRAKEVGRPILRLFPQLRTRVRGAVSEGFVDVRNFDATLAVKSLETSLKRLKRDCIDIYFLHECRLTDLNDDRLLSFLGQAKQRGQIRCFGIATDIDTIEQAANVAKSYTAVVQMPNNFREPNLDRFPILAANHACLTHSPFGGFGRGTIDDIGSALLYSAKRNPNGIVLFSSQNLRHIADNVNAFTAYIPEVK